MASIVFVVLSRGSSPVEPLRGSGGAWWSRLALIPLRLLPVRGEKGLLATDRVLSTPVIGGNAPLSPRTGRGAGGEGI